MTTYQYYTIPPGSLDWNLEQMPDESMPVFGSPVFERKTEKEKAEAMSANDQVVAQKFERGIRERMSEIQAVAAV